MSNQQRLSAPILAVGIVILIGCFLLGWYALKHRPATSAASSESQSDSGATGKPKPAAAPDSPAPSVANGDLPPVIPLPLAPILVEAENGYWSRDDAWKTMPRGTQYFGGIQFHIDGLALLRSLGSDRGRRDYRSEIDVSLSGSNSITAGYYTTPVGTNIGCLHLLGAAGYADDWAEGGKIAEVVWRFENGEVRRTPIVFNEHLREWRRIPYEEPERLPYAGAKVAWRGAEFNRPDQHTRLYRLTLPNPSPKQVIKRIDFVSAMGEGNLFFVALTLDPLKMGARPDDSPDLEETDPDGGSLMVFVQGPDQRPVPGARVHANFNLRNDGKTSRKSRSLATDANGACRLRLFPSGMEQLELGASLTDVLTPRKMVWDISVGDTLPESYTFNLTNGITVGGFVVDPDDQPIVEARISLSRYFANGESPLARGESADAIGRRARTDAQGRWQISGVSEELLPRAVIGVAHPDYVEPPSVIASEGNAGRGNLRDATYKIVLQRGALVRGKVTDQSENPVASARVTAGPPYAGKNTYTDAKGEFRYRSLNPGPSSFSVVAKGFRPESKSVEITSNLTEVAFKLFPGKLVRGIVKSETGEPIPGVRLVLEDEQGGTAQDFNFAMTSGADGRFEWDGAPDKPRRFSISKEGYKFKRQQVLTAGEENVVVLGKGQKIEGTVVDADTGGPVTKFNISLGRFSSVDSFSTVWSSREFSNPAGKFIMDITEENITAIQANAEDYADHAQPLPESDSNPMTVEIRLKPSPALQAVLVTANGVPVPGAAVFLISSSRGGGLQFVNGRLQAFGRVGSVTTDAAGQFVIPSPSESGTVLAATDAGFARASVADVRASGRLVLQEFGRIEGVIKIAGAPTAGRDCLFVMNVPRISIAFNNFKTTSDEQGRFSFEKIPPGAGAVFWLLPDANGDWTRSHSTPVSVESGKTAQVIFGEPGSL